MQKVASHAVPFSRYPAGHHDVTWAQQQVLKMMHSNGQGQFASGAARTWSKFDEAKGFPSLADFLRSVSVVVGRHDALRTHYLPGGERGWRQSVVGDGSLLVDEYSSEDADLDWACSELAHILAVEPFAQDDLPLRCAALTVGGHIRCFAMAIHHASADGAALAIVCAEIRHFCADESEHLPIPTQPRQIAEWEMSPTQQRNALRADVYHRECMRQIPVCTDEEKLPTSGPLYRQWILDSTAAAHSARVLAHRHGVSMATVILSAYGIVVGQHHGRRVFTARMPVSNRYGEFRDTVVNLFQTTPLSIDLTADSFGSLCRQVAASSALVYRHGHYDPDRLEASRRKIEEERGSRLHMPFRVSIQIGGTGSDRDSTKVAQQESAVKQPEWLYPQEAAALRARSRYRPAHGKPSWPDSTLKFDVWRIDAEASITLGTDSESYDEDDLLCLLHAFEDILIAAATSPGDVAVRALQGTVRNAVFQRPVNDR
ncbi:condensation domain-containing protein [Streptomyces sp. ME19-01-6]|uniref:condensation domain-containing protein n=1 Tax=Streptomyces sp. ME19-01-6 TaxID=3028686 RepID=UPI0029AFAB88|nr:condensation domain-containing protein [Streptomyces sp. ME19-01-6]MDX3225235.1 condensation domain-containing protein [Streptomyces sp. ME19-01-6]